MTEETGLTADEVSRRIESGRYVLEGDGENKHLVAVGIPSIYDIIYDENLGFLLDLWFKCWRASKYGIPKPKYINNAFRGPPLQRFEDDDDMIKKISIRRKIYNEWIKLCTIRNIKYCDFEWLFIGETPTPIELNRRIGGARDIRALIVRSLDVFRLANG